MGVSLEAYRYCIGMYSQKCGNSRKNNSNMWTTQMRQRKWNLLLSMITIVMMLTVSGSYNFSECRHSKTVNTASQKSVKYTDNNITPCPVRNNQYRYNPSLYSITKPYDNSHTCPASLLSVT